MCKDLEYGCLKLIFEDMPLALGLRTEMNRWNPTPTKTGIEYVSDIRSGGLPIQQSPR